MAITNKDYDNWIKDGDITESARGNPSEAKRQLRESLKIGSPVPAQTKGSHGSTGKGVGMLKDIGNDILAAGAGGVEGLGELATGLGNIATAIPRKFNKNIPAFQKPEFAKELRESHPVSSTLGEIASSFLLPEGAAVKAAPKVAKVAEKYVPTLSHMIGAGLSKAATPAEAGVLSAIYGASDPSHGNLMEDLGMGALGAAGLGAAGKGVGILGNHGLVAAKRFLGDTKPSGLYKKTMTDLNQVRHTIRKKKDEAFNTAKEAIKKAGYHNEGPNKLETPNFENYMDGITQQKENSSRVPKDLFNDLDTYKKNRSLQNAGSMSKNLKNHAGDLLNSGDDFKRGLGSQLSGANDLLEKDIKKSLGDKYDIRALQKGADKYYKENYTPFKKGTILRKNLDKFENGKETITPAQMFSKEGSDLKEAYKKLPEETQNLIAYDALGNLTSTIDGEGYINNLSKAYDKSVSDKHSHLFGKGESGKSLSKYLKNAKGHEKVKNSVLSAGVMAGLSSILGYSPGWGIAAGALTHAKPEAAEYLIDKAVEGVGAAKERAPKLAKRGVKGGASRLAGLALSRDVSGAN